MSDPLSHIVAIIPARDEEAVIARVVRGLPDGLLDVIVVDNGSVDDTAARARQAGAQVVFEPAHGYGAACLAGVAAAGACDILLFLDGDGSDDGGEADIVLGPILNGEADLVIGSRVLGRASPGTMTMAQRAGNALAALLIRLIWNADCTDLGPYRAITAEAYHRLGMVDRDFGWTVEMQARAYGRGLRVREVPVSRGPRLAGRSKITGTISGVLRAGVRILSVIGREACSKWARDVLSGNRKDFASAFVPDRATHRARRG